MAGFSLGFGSGGSSRQYGYSGGGGGGFLGPIGSSIAATMSPDREPGIVGGVRAFLDPEPVKLAEMQRREREGQQTVLDQVSKFEAEAFKSMALGDKPGALASLQKARNHMAMFSDANEGNSRLDLYDRMMENLSMETVGKLDPKSATYNQDFIGAAPTYDQATQARLRQDQGDAYNAGAAQTREETTQLQGLYPGKIAQQGAELTKTQEETETENAQQRKYEADAAYTGDQAARVRTQRDIDLEELNSVRNKGYKLPTGPPDRQRSTVGPEVDDISAHHNKGLDIANEYNAGKKMGSVSMPYTYEEMLPGVDSYNALSDQMEQWYPGRDVQRLEIVEVAGPEKRDTKTGQMIPGEKQYRVRRAEPRRGGQVTLPPGAGPTTGATAPQAANLAPPDLADVNIPPQAMPEVKRLKAEREAALAAARTPEQQREIKAWYRVRVREAITARAAILREGAGREHRP